LSRESEFLFVGEEPALDFINTRIRENGEDVELLVSLADFVRWLNQSPLLDYPLEKELLHQWRGSTKDKALSRIKTFRQNLQEMVDQMITDGTPTDACLRQLSKFQNRSFGKTELKYKNDKLEQMTRPEPNAPLDLVAPIAKSTVQFLMEKDWELIKKCENPECVLYYYDTTKNHSRKWCSMELCGNRMKARRHYQRQKSNGAN